MNVPTPSIRVNTLRATVPIALAIAAFAFMGARANAADLDQVTVDGPVVKTVGFDIGTLAPIERVTVTARVATDPETLTYPSGVALFNDNVREAARKACIAADPLRPDDGTCVRKAIEAAKPQVAAAIAQAKSDYAMEQARSAAASAQAKSDTAKSSASG
jgi:UrcA family protein